MKNRVKHYDNVFRVNNPMVFYLVNKTELIILDELIIQNIKFINKTKLITLDDLIIQKYQRY